MTVGMQWHQTQARNSLGLPGHESHWQGRAEDEGLMLQAARMPDVQNDRRPPAGREGGRES
eukprot:1908972-Rhodomonas_salina.2